MKRVGFPTEEELAWAIFNWFADFPGFPPGECLPGKWCLIERDGYLSAYLTSLRDAGNEAIQTEIKTMIEWQRTKFKTPVVELRKWTIRKQFPRWRELGQVLYRFKLAQKI